MKDNLLNIVKNNINGIYDFINELSFQHMDGETQRTAKLIQLDNNGALIYYPKNGGKQMRFYAQLESFDIETLKMIINDMQECLDIFELEGNYESDSNGYVLGDLTAIGIIDGIGDKGTEFWLNKDESLVATLFDFEFPTKAKYDTYALSLLETEMKKTT